MRGLPCTPWTKGLLHHEVLITTDGKACCMQATWAGPHTLATASLEEPLVRLFDFDAETNYTLAVDPQEFSFQGQALCSQDDAGMRQSPFAICCIATGDPTHKFPMKMLVHQPPMGERPDKSACRALAGSVPFCMLWVGVYVFAWLQRAYALA
jgi:hypothetical protein